MLRTGFVFDEPLRTPTYSTKFHTQAYRSGHNEAVLKTVCLTGTGVRIPQPAPKNKDTPCGCPLFFATARGDEPEGFAYRRHRAHHEEETLRGICVARRYWLKFIPNRNGFYKPHPEQHTPLPSLTKRNVI